MNISYQDALAHYGIEGAHPGRIILTKKILEGEKMNGSTKILDAGCGTGQTSSFMAKQYSCKVYSIDSHSEMIKKAAKRFSNEGLSIKLIKGSMEKMPFPNQYFDFILAESSTVFTDIKKTIPEYFRVLKPEGVLITIDMTAEPSLSSFAKDELKRFYGIKTILTEKEWKEQFKRAGFKTIHTMKSSTVLQEMEEYSFTEEEQHEYSSETIFNPMIEQVMLTHQELTLQYGNQLGYRVFRNSKK